MADYHIEELNPSNEDDWEKFIQKTEGGSLFHTLKWKNIIESSLDYKLYYYLIYFNDKVIAVCPFSKNTIKGFQGLMPPPNAEYRHILIDKEHCNRLVIEEILRKSQEIATENDLSFVLLTTISPGIRDSLNVYKQLHSYPIFGRSGHMVLDLKENNPEKIWNHYFSERGGGRPRQYIRKFEKDGIGIRVAESEEDIKIFYKFYKESARHWNIKPYPFSYFVYIWNTFSPEDIRISFLCNDKQVFGGLIAFLYPDKKIMYLRHLALSRKIPGRYHPAYYLIWDAVVNASNMNYDKICFGETPFDPNDVGYRIKFKFGCNYEFEYSYVLPISFIFKVGYYMYKPMFFLKYGLEGKLRK